MILRESRDQRPSLNHSIRPNVRRDGISRQRAAVREALPTRPAEVNEEGQLSLSHRWREEVEKTGRDGFWWGREREKHLFERDSTGCLFLVCNILPVKSSRNRNTKPRESIDVHPPCPGNALGFLKRVERRARLGSQ